VRYLLSAVWILLSAGAASADWNEVMEAIERAAGGTAYEIVADPSEPDRVATRKARFEREGAQIRGVDLRSEILRAQIACPEPTLDDTFSSCN